MPDASFDINDPDSMKRSTDIRHHLMSGTLVESVDLQRSYGLQVECLSLSFTLISFLFVLPHCSAPYCPPEKPVHPTPPVDLSFPRLCRCLVLQRDAQGSCFPRASKAGAGARSSQTCSSCRIVSTAWLCALVTEALVAISSSMTLTYERVCHPSSA